MKLDIRSLSKTDIELLISEMGEKPFRAKQIYLWLWKRGARSIADMANLPKSVRENLQENYTVLPAKISKEQKSKDGTVKSVIRLPDNNLVEGVLIPSFERVTACISSQVGCAMDCEFCATGQMGFTRNLSVGEIFDQVFLLNKRSEKLYGRGLSNVVVMGMGEPMMNLENLVEAIKIITNPDLIGMSPRRITVSTVGLPVMMRKFADHNLRVHFSISLHTAIDKKRSEIMPVNKRNKLSELREAIRYFHEKTGERLTYEYVLFNNINDGREDFEALAEFCKVSPCKINLIEYNTTDNNKFKKSSSYNTQAFTEFLESKNLIVNVRRSRGQDIDAACGQLANKSK